MISDEAENHEEKNPQPQGGVSIESERIETSPIESTVSVLDDNLKIFEASLEKSVVSPPKISINNISPFDSKLENPSEITVGLEERSLEDFDLQKFDYEGWLRDRYQDPARCRKSNIGVSYQNLNVYGFETYADYQKTFWNYPISYFGALRQLFGQSRKVRTDILRNFEGLVKSGELLMVLGRPGSGCTTLLKTLAGRTHGFFVDSGSLLNYQGKMK
jgi:ABC-type multidrug transport system fused ATPase/permease subunit